MIVVDVSFPIVGGLVHSDSRYDLLAAVSNVVPCIHGAKRFAIHPITGRQIGNRMIELTSKSCVCIRTGQDQIGELLELAGKTLRLGNAEIKCGYAPSIHQIRPAATLRSHLVTVNRSDRKVDQLSFEDAVRRQLCALGVSEQVAVDLPERRSRSGEVRSAQRTLRIKDREIIGFEVRLHNLDANESLAVQSVGVGGRRSMGCGLFTPFHPKGDCDETVTAK